MKSKVFKIFLLLYLSIQYSYSQKRVYGTVKVEDSENENSIVFIYDGNSKLLTETNENGFYEFYTEKKEMNVIFLLVGSQYIEEKIIIKNELELNVVFEKQTKVLSEVIITGQKIREFELQRLNDVEGTAIYAGKKTEVILVDQSMANLASNNSRQIYSQISGLNIYQNDDAGIQLHIGGRGLDPNRTSNFNTRQNGYDISADVLGYPESYYTPPAEAIKNIQIIRGAASLQYGTQFGGLINFIMKDPPNKKFEFITRNSIGSNLLFTNFTSVGGKNKKFSYFSYYNFKRGNGFRQNSRFNSNNFYIHFNYAISTKTSISSEISYIKYLAKQAGGLSDRMFNTDPYQSNRSRNWFYLNWLLYNFKFSHKFSDKSSFLFNFFGLKADRNSIGFRTNRVDQIDPIEERDLIKGTFNNFGFEGRYLKNYELLKKNSFFVLGIKFYKSKNLSVQGPGSENSNADFNFYLDKYPSYQNQSNYIYPNENLAFFGENIFYVNDKLSITPGFRFENIITRSDGSYKQINLDGAGNVIYNNEVFEKRKNTRRFVLLGIGISYKLNSGIEFYGNVSQNYRSVTFADMSIINPSYSINPDITDEKGVTTDIGVRGNINKKISYEITAFNLLYNDRIGFIQKEFNDGSIKSERGNVGDASIYGIESIIDFDLNNLLINNQNMSLNYFINTGIIDSKYTRSKENGVVGKKVEFVPNVNIKTGIKYGIKNFLSNIQLTYLSSQYTDSSNATKGNMSGVIGEIPQYLLLDISFSFKYNKVKAETGINNLLDEEYFTRRATGYPGPGIITSPPRNIYFTLEIRI
tara:strand:- start:5177 stop:7600 length:2424 start_codon:yes stop_codon:yes gene_type:complete